MSGIEVESGRNLAVAQSAADAKTISNLDHDSQVRSTELKVDRVHRLESRCALLVLLVLYFRIALLERGRLPVSGNLSSAPSSRANCERIRSSEYPAPHLEAGDRLEHTARQHTPSRTRHLPALLDQRQWRYVPRQCELYGSKSSTTLPRIVPMPSVSAG